MSLPDGLRVARAGSPIERARAFVLLVHGRGASAESILALASELVADLEDTDVAFAAPQAEGFSWYPQSFIAPMEHNEPRLSAGLAALDAVLDEAESAGLAGERQMLIGFSQGACLTLEYAARHPRRFGGVAAWTGGLIGPPGTSRDYPGTFDGTPVFLGSSDPDPHVPWARVEESATVLGRMGAAVSLERYPGMAHTINCDEVDAARRMLAAVGGWPTGLGRPA